MYPLHHITNRLNAVKWYQIYSSRLMYKINQNLCLLTGTVSLHPGPVLLDDFVWFASGVLKIEKWNIYQQI